MEQEQFLREAATLQQKLDRLNKSTPRKWVDEEFGGHIEGWPPAASESTSADATRETVLASLMDEEAGRQPLAD